MIRVVTGGRHWNECIFKNTVKLDLYVFPSDIAAQWEILAHWDLLDKFGPSKQKILVLRDTHTVESKKNSGHDCWLTQHSGYPTLMTTSLLWHSCELKVWQKSSHLENKKRRTRSVCENLFRGIFFEMGSTSEKWVWLTFRLFWRMNLNKYLNS